jgi:CopG family nickel-responsive transcriptional regulator
MWLLFRGEDPPRDKPNLLHDLLSPLSGKSDERGSRRMGQTVRFGVSMTEDLLTELDDWIARKGYPNRSEAIRQIVRAFVSEAKWEQGIGNVCGAFTVIYNHHNHDVAHELTHLQHKFGDIIVCTTHVHMDEARCLEVVILKGDVNQIKTFLEAAAGFKSLASVSPSFVSI